MSRFVGDVFVGRELNGSARAPVPRSLSAPHPPLEGIGEDELWVWHPGDEADEEPTAEDYRQAQRVETYILGLIQRRSLPTRSNKPRTSLGPEIRGVIRQSSISRKEPAYVPWADDEQRCSGRYPRPVLAGIRSTSLDFPSSEAESPQHVYQHAHSPSSDELVNAQYIPAQPCRAQAYKAPKAGRSPERKPRAAPKKCRFTEEKITSKKPGRKACRAQSENNLRGVSERKYNTAERNVTPKTRRGSGHRRWRSTLELSQDEAETEQPIRRSRKPRPPPCVYNQPAPHLHTREDPPGESESSLSEAESPASSSLSSDSDESGGLVWPQQLAPPSPPGNTLQPKAFVKIKASHALKKKILRFRTGSLKVMTTV